MSEHFVIKNIRRSIKEAQSRKGMIVGLPEIRIPASHAEVLLGELDRLTAQLAERDKLIEDQQAEIAHLTFRGSDEARGRLDAEYAIEHLRVEVERLTERLQANAAKIDEEDVVIEWADYLELKAEARKEAAQEIIQYIIDQGIIEVGWNKQQVYEIDRSDIDELRQRYGLTNDAAIAIAALEYKEPIK